MIGRGRFHQRVGVDLAIGRVFQALLLDLRHVLPDDLAGQLTGVEGYLESAATGLAVALYSLASGLVASVAGGYVDRIGWLRAVRIGAVTNAADVEGVLPRPVCEASRQRHAVDDGVQRQPERRHHRADQVGGGDARTSQRIHAVGPDPG